MPDPETISPPAPVEPARRPRAVRNPLEPRDELQRTLNRIKGEGRRRIVADLCAMGMPLRRIPRLLRQESISAFQYEALRRRTGFDLAGERLPDLLPGEVEVVRAVWRLPTEPRVISLRARHHPRSSEMVWAAWRAVAEDPEQFTTMKLFSPWPVDPDFVYYHLLELRCETGSHGVILPCWEQAKDLGFDRERTRRSFQVRSTDTRLEEAVTALVDEVFQKAWYFFPAPKPEETVQ